MSISSPTPQNVARGLCTKFNAQQLLFEAFSHIFLYGDTEFIFSNKWLAKFYLRWAITNYQANLCLILVTFLFGFHVFMWNVLYTVSTVYYSELCLN